MCDTKTVREALAFATQKLRNHPIGTPELDARLLLENLLGYSHAQMISNAGDVISPLVLQKFYAQIDERLAGKPAHRLLGQREFYGRDFLLNEATLIPRPDTEVLVETVLEALGGVDDPIHILEIGTGSGIIAITLACELPKAKVTASDLSSKALEQAMANAERYHVSDRIRFVEADLFSGMKGKFDVIVSNPPYIPSSDILNLAQEVQEHDPLLALDGGADGLNFYRQILTDAPHFLKPNGLVAVEVGVGQADLVIELGKQNKFEEFTKQSDLSDIDRVVTAKYK